MTNILSVPFCLYHFVCYHFVLEPQFTMEQPMAYVK